MRGALDLPVSLLKREPKLLELFGGASLARAGLGAASILLIREFLAVVLGHTAGVTSIA